MQKTTLLKAAIWAAIVACTAIVYWPALGAGFVGDDVMILHRLRAVSSPIDAFRFFRGEFFEYYRPLGFVSHAFDWLIAGLDARQFHLTNLLLHLANTSLVFLIGSAPAVAGGCAGRRIAAGAAAAVLFGLHASNHEAVIWMSARFDLLATFFALAAVWWVVAGGSGARGLGGAGLLFFLALLSKESVVALPIAAAAWAVFRMRATTGGAIRWTVPWIVALGVYAILRSVAGGIPATGGAGRLPKLIAFAAILVGVIALADSRWVRVRDWLRPRRGFVVPAGAIAIAAVAIAAAWFDGPVGSLAREKLAVAGFAIFYLLSPVVDAASTPHFLDPATNVYWLGGVAALVVLTAVVTVLWRPLIDTDVAWFVAAWLAATLIPISALTEGKRYLYLPSAAVALLAALLLVDLQVRARRLAVALAAAVVAISAWQIPRKAADWIWAGAMTADGARLADAAVAPGCGGQVVFLTSPVAVRGVYTHFYYETFELPRGCRPEVFHVLVRVVRLDTKIDVRWEPGRRIVITAPEYAGNFVLSSDLRHFDRPLRVSRTVSIQTPLGLVEAEAAGSRQRVSLTLDPAVRPEEVRFLYYSEGRMHPWSPR